MIIEDIVWPEYPKPPVVPWKKAYDRNSKLEYPGATFENVDRYEKDYAEYLKVCHDLDKIRNETVKKLHKLLVDVGLNQRYQTKTKSLRTVNHYLVDAIAPFIPRNGCRVDGNTSEVKRWLQVKKEESFKKEEAKKKEQQQTSTTYSWTKSQEQTTQTTTDATRELT